MTRRNEDGAALIIALAFLSLFGTFVAAVLAFADTGMRTVVTVRGERRTAYVADGAVQAAINAMRVPGNDGSTCVAPSSLDAVPVTVTCEIGGPVATSAPTETNTILNTPGRAVLTLSQNTAENGLVKASNSDTLIYGGVFSNTNVKANPGGGSWLRVTGDLTARTGCTGNVKVDPPDSGEEKCSIGSTANPNGDDPGYPKAISSVPPLRSVPSCSRTVTFQPGYYNDADALTNLMSGGCAGGLFWFAPGVYYFDFRSASHVWKVSDGGANVVGGSPKGWDPSGGLTARPTVPIPGGCATDQDSTIPNAGVQFIFGGDSRFELGSGSKVELCAQPSLSKQQIAIYGVPSGVSAQSAQLQPTSVSAASGFTQPERALAVDGATADAAVAAGSPPASMTLNGFDQVPIGTGTGWYVDKVTLRVTHQEVSGANSLRVRVLSGTTQVATVVSGSGSGCNSASSLCIRSTLGQDTIDLTSSINTTDKLQNLSVVYEAGVSGSSGTGTAKLDGLSIEARFLMPGFHAQNGCVVAQPYDNFSTTAGAPCPLVRTSGNNTTLVVQGTIYAPRAVIDLQMPSAATARIGGRGVISRVLRLNITASNSSTEPTIYVPERAPNTGSSTSTSGPTYRDVVLTAVIDGKPRLRAKVRFHSDGTTAPTVLDWSVLQ